MHKLKLAEGISSNNSQQDLVLRKFNLFIKWTKINKNVNIMMYLMKVIQIIDLCNEVERHVYFIIIIIEKQR